MRGLTFFILYSLIEFSATLHFGVSVDVVANDLAFLLDELNESFYEETKYLSGPIPFTERHVSCDLANRNDKIRWIYCAYNETNNALRRLKSTKGLNARTLEKLVMLSTKVLCDLKLYLLQIVENGNQNALNLDLPGCQTEKCNNRSEAIFRTILALRDAKNVVLKMTENVRPVLEEADEKNQPTATTVPSIIEKQIQTTEYTDANILSVNKTNTTVKRKSNRRGKRRRRRRCKNKRNKKQRRKCRRRLNKRRRIINKGRRGNQKRRVYKKDRNRKH